MDNLWTILIIFIQPALWLGGLRMYLRHHSRVKKERLDYNTAIYAQNFEIKHFMIAFVTLGILGSVISFALGTFLSISWILVYEILVLVNLIIIPSQFMPILTLGISTIIIYFLNALGMLSDFDLGSFNLTLTSYQNVLALLVIVLILMGCYTKFFLGNYNSPKIFKNKRGIKVAGYLTKECTIIPLLVLIPGQQIRQTISFWPVFAIGHHTFSIFILPILLGIRLTIFKSVPKQFFQYLSKQIFKLAGLGVLLTIISYYVASLSIYAIIVLVLLYLVVLLLAKRHDHNAKQWFGEAVEGLRVIAVRPNTPADKMGTQIGDLIVEVNNQKVNTESDFYKAILSSPTFCRLKVYNRNGRIKIEETAIYSDAPNELGVVLLSEKY